MAEHALELSSPLSFTDYMRQNVPTPVGMTLSTFATASTSKANLARGCSRNSCSYGIPQTTVKASS